MEGETEIEESRRSHGE